MKKSHIFTIIVRKYNSQISNKNSFNYLKKVTSVLKDFSIGKVAGLDNEDVLKTEFLKHIGVYIDNVSKSVYYKEVLDNPYYFQGYKYYANDGHDITYCIKHQTKIKILIAQKFARGCSYFDFLYFQ